MKLNGEMDDIIKRAGLIIERRAKENISGKHGHYRHIITGNLRRSITTEVEKLNMELYRVAVGTDVYYAAWVEAKDKSGGYLRPAFFESKDIALNYIADEIAKSIRGL